MKRFRYFPGRLVRYIVRFRISVDSYLKRPQTSANRFSANPTAIKSSDSRTGRLGTTPLPRTPELSSGCPDETFKVNLWGGWSTFLNLLWHDSSQDIQSDLKVSYPSIPTFAFKWISADNGYCVKKSAFMRVSAGSPYSHLPIFGVSGVRCCSLVRR